MLLKKILQVSKITWLVHFFKFISFINIILYNYYQAKFMSMNNIAIARSVWPNYCEQPFFPFLM